MRRYFFISFGGVLGALARYLIKGINIYSPGGCLPVNTLIINITGSFILALALTIAFEYREFDPDIRLGFTTGFLGAYTTFSTLCKETATMMSGGFYITALSYVLISAVLGIAAVYSGIVFARLIISKAAKVKGDCNEADKNSAEGEAK